MGRILTEFLDKNKGNVVKFFFINGYQLKGRVLKYDDHHILIRTDDYGNGKEVPVSIATITTFVPC